MKQKLTMMFLLFVVLIQTIGLVFDFPWEGIIVWVLTVGSVVAAAYFTKYLP